MASSVQQDRDNTRDLLNRMATTIRKDRTGELSPEWAGAAEAAIQAVLLILERYWAASPPELPFTTMARMKKALEIVIRLTNEDNDDGSITVPLEWHEAKMDGIRSQAQGGLEEPMKPPDFDTHDFSNYFGNSYDVFTSWDAQAGWPYGRRGRPSRKAPDPPRTGCWEVLECDETKEEATIKAAYRRKAQKVHPDKKTGSVGEMQLLNSAYQEALGAPGVG